LRLHDNVHVATEPCQHPHDAFHGDIGKSPWASAKDRAGSGRLCWPQRSA
jgi:hypothetical protein